MKILFIDEEVEIEVLARVIQTRHPNDIILLVDDLMTAREKLWSTKFDVAVVDIMMPSDDKAVPGSSDESGLISGLLLMDMVQADKGCVNKETPFVILTGLSPKEHPKVREAEQKFGKNFIIKPDHPDILYEAISNAAKKQ